MAGCCCVLWRSPAENSKRANYTKISTPQDFLLSAVSMAMTFNNTWEIKYRFSEGAAKVKTLRLMVAMQ